MLRRAKPPSACQAGSCYAHLIFSAWFQISDYFLLSMTNRKGVNGANQTISMKAAS